MTAPLRAQAAAFAAPGRGGPPGLWRVPLGFVGVYAAALTVAGLGLAPLSTLGGINDGGVFRLFASLTGIALISGTLALWLRIAHGRSFRTLFGPARRLDIPMVLTAAALTAGLYLLATLAAVAAGTVTLSLRDEAVAAPLWPVAALAFLCVTPFQAAAEELLYRGYLLQELACRSTSLWAWAVGPSVLFGLVHWRPEATPFEAWMIVGNAGVFGLFTAWLTVLFGNLSAAIGVHWGYNLVGLSLFESPYGVGGPAPLALAPGAGVQASDLLAGWLLVDLAIYALMVFALWAWRRPKTGAVNTGGPS